MQPAHCDLHYSVDLTEGTGNKRYVDTARSLSRLNRRLYSQERMYAYQGLTFIWRANAGSTVSTIEVKVKSAGNTWVVQNSYVKARALWHEMQALVLEDNPSVKGKWHDFKTRLEFNMTPGRTLNVLDGGSVAITAGEWDISTFVMPQHEVDPATGQPLAADEYTTTLVGTDSTFTRSIVKAYQESRATVQDVADPNVPPGMETSFFNLLTDSGSQEPELATVIQDEGDLAPYAVDAYVGGDANGVNPLIVGYGAISQSEVDGRIGGFVAPCGLLQFEITGYDSAGAVVPDADMPELEMILHVAPGGYKGVAAIPMGQ